MSERPPAEPSPDTPEREPVTYERALDAVRALKAAGVEDPFDDEDPRVLEGLTAMDEWYHSKNLHMRGVGSPEKAADLVRAARIFLDAGYTGKSFVDAALEKLRDEHADARREGDVSVTETLGTAVDVLEAILPPEKKEKPADILNAKVLEARRLADEGKVKDAMGTLSLALIDPRFKRLSQAMRDAVQTLRDELKARM